MRRWWSPAGVGLEWSGCSISMIRPVSSVSSSVNAKTMSLRSVCSSISTMLGTSTDRAVLRQRRQDRRGAAGGPPRGGASATAIATSTGRPRIDLAVLLEPEHLAAQPRHVVDHLLGSVDDGGAVALPLLDQRRSSGGRNRGRSRSRGRARRHSRPCAARRRTADAWSHASGTCRPESGQVLELGELDDLVPPLAEKPAGPVEEPRGEEHRLLSPLLPGVADDVGAQQRRDAPAHERSGPRSAGRRRRGAAAAPCAPPGWGRRSRRPPRPGRRS